MAQSNVSLRLNPADEIIFVGPLQFRFLVTGAQSHGSMAIFEVVIPAGAKLLAPPHSHDAFEETLYGLEGVSAWTVDGVVIEVGPGQALCIPRGAVHSFVNRGPVDAKALTVMSPAVIGPEFFREMGAVINAAQDTPPDRAKMAEIMRRYGLTPAPTPTA